MPARVHNGLLPLFAGPRQGVSRENGNNAVWEKSNDFADISLDRQVELDKSQQLAIRRARLGVEILKRPSDSRTKYDLFQRLNAGGTPANSQELRNCIIIMISQSYFDFVKLLADHDLFLTVLAASDDQIDRQLPDSVCSRCVIVNLGARTTDSTPARDATTSPPAQHELRPSPWEMSR